MSTGIEWCDETYNPIIGCGGCELGNHCYAWKFAARLSGQPKTHDDYHAVLRHVNNYGEEVTWGTATGWNGECRFIESRLNDPLKWKKPRRVFVNSMGDFFAAGVKPEWVDRVLGVIRVASWHQFIILTKRPENIESKMLDNLRADWPNLIIGVSATNSRDFRDRFAALCKVWPGKRAASIEPILGRILMTARYPGNRYRAPDWVIAGPETGAGKRPSDPAWFDALARECAELSIPYFDKRPDWLFQGGRREFVK